jgi:hypothetical protein
VALIVDGRESHDLALVHPEHTDDQQQDAGTRRERKNAQHSPSDPTPLS